MVMSVEVVELKKLLYFVLSIFLLCLPYEVVGTPVIPVEPMKMVAVASAGGVTKLPVMGGKSYTRLRISPTHKHIELKPGEYKEFKVRVKNLENRTITLQPQLLLIPFAESVMDESWVSLTPEKAVLKPSGEEEFTVRVSVPEDAEVGYYSAQIAFTNETIEYPVPRAVNGMDLSIRVWKEPTVKIGRNYINARVEAGKSYTYEIAVENRGEKPISLSPRLITTDRGCAGFGCPKSIEDSWIEIDAPESVMPESKATVRIKVHIPETARGRYEGRVDLGVEDPARAYTGEWWRTVEIMLEVWQKPAVPFERAFSVDAGREKLTVMVTAKSYNQKVQGGGVENTKPSFTLALIDPEGKEHTPVLEKKVIKESITLGTWYLPPWEEDSQGIYTVQSSEYTAYYSVSSPEAGRWLLKIMPVNATNFEYSIVLE